MGNKLKKRQNTRYDNLIENNQGKEKLNSHDKEFREMEKYLDAPVFLGIILSKKTERERK